MSKITFITKDGTATTVTASEGSLMEVAKNNNIKGIDGDCGGVCSCATCHIYIEDDFAHMVNQASDIEKDTLEFDELTAPQSRLSCQVPVTAALDGITVRIARD